MKKLSLLFSMLALVALSLNSCKDDDDSYTPVTPEAKPVETFVGVAISTDAFEFLEATATHVDADGKETPCQFTVFDEKNQDHQWVSDHNAAWLKRFGTTASIIYAKVSGTTAKTFTNKFNVSVKLKEGYQFKETKMVNIAIRRGTTDQKIVLPGDNTWTFSDCISFSRTGDNSRTVTYINKELSDAQYTAEAK